MSIISESNWNRRRTSTYKNSSLRDQGLLSWSSVVLEEEIIMQQFNNKTELRSHATRGF